MVALIVHEPDVVFVEDPNIGSILLGANSTLSESNYLMATIVVDSEVDVARVVEYLAGGFVDGAIVVSARVEDPVTRAIEQFAVPAVFIGSMPILPNATSVGIDNLEASREITTRLLATGRSKVGMIAAALDRTSGADRLAGFEAALGDSFTSSLVVPVDLYTYAAGRAGMQELLSREPLIDGVVAASDAIAAGAMSVLREHGRRIPEDVGVVGFDDSAWALRCNPPLSTVHQPASEVGRVASELVLRLIDGEVVGVGTVLETPVVWRDSA
jgi:Transcriptional regulators